MLRKVLLGLAALIIVLLGIIYTRSSTFRVERTARIEAPPDVVFALVNDLHAWDRWSPWAHLDPSMKVTYAGPPSGPGAGYHWTGNDKVGEGDMRITETKPMQAVGIRLQFIKPFASVNRVEFTFKPDGSGTKVNWAMSGPLDFMGKGMDLFIGMDKMIGADFEKGLASLRREAEADAKKRADAATASASAPVSAPVVPAAATAPAPAK